MAYAAIADVQALMAKFVISATSTPTTTQAEGMITQVSNDIDRVLAQRGVAVPVTTPAYFTGWLTAVNSWGAAAAVLKSMFPGATGPGENPAWAFWEKRYQDALKAIADSDLPSEITEGTTGAAIAQTYLTENPDQEIELGDIAESVFKVGTTF